MAGRATAQGLPRWNMEVVFPGLDSAQFDEALVAIAGKITGVKAVLDEAELGTDGIDRARLFDRVATELNHLLEQITTANAYIYSFISTEAGNELAQARQSELDAHLVEVAILETRLVRWLGFCGNELIKQSKVAAEHAFFIEKAAVRARHQMTQPEEDLAAALAVPGIEAWSRLHGNVTGALTADVQFPGGTERLPMSLVRALAHDPDPVRRKAGFDAEQEAWNRVKVPLASCLNGIKGWVNSMNVRRGWPDSIEPALLMNNVDRATLEAMQAAVEEALPDFRRYLKAKARFLNQSELSWWDLNAPVSSNGPSTGWSYAHTAEFIEAQFSKFSPKLTSLARRAFREDWIDAEPRTGKHQGGYCMTVRGEESRIMVNFEPSFDSLQTLAHELGHAYHHYAIAGRTALQKRTPMALAETASTFCQAIVFNAALEEAGGDQQLAMLESSLQDATSYVVDIHSRFLFEKSLFEGRQKRELSVTELCDLMLAAQRHSYGDGLEPSMHPYMWAAKLHYYICDISYYNWPYTFGMLFAFALYERFRQDPADFPARYDDLLASTGVEDAASLAARFGMDVRSIDFWRSSLDVCRARIGRFEKIAAPINGQGAQKMLDSGAGSA